MDLLFLFLILLGVLLVITVGLIIYQYFQKGILPGPFSIILIPVIVTYIVLWHHYLALNQHGAQ